MSQAGAVSSSSSSGNLVLLSNQTVSGASQVAFTSVITTAYDDYEIRFNSLQGAGGATFLYGQFSTNNGSSYLSAANYSTEGYYSHTAGQAFLNIGGQTQMRFCDNFPTGAGGQFAGIIEFINISSGSFMPVSLGRIMAAGNLQENANYCNNYLVAIAVNALKIYPDAGTISGTFKLYGVQK